MFGGLTDSLAGLCVSNLSVNGGASLSVDKHDWDVLARDANFDSRVRRIADINIIGAPLMNW